MAVLVFFFLFSSSRNTQVRNCGVSLCEIVIRERCSKLWCNLRRTAFGIIFQNNIQGLRRPYTRSLILKAAHTNMRIQRCGTRTHSTLPEISLFTLSNAMFNTVSCNTVWGFRETDVFRRKRIPTVSRLTLSGCHSDTGVKKTLFHERKSGNTVLKKKVWEECFSTRTPCISATHWRSQLQSWRNVGILFFLDTALSRKLQS